MDITGALLTRIAKDPKAIVEAIDSGVSPELFAEPDREIYSFCLTFYKDFGGAPSQAAVEDQFPDFDRWVDSTEPTAWFFHEVRRTYKQQQLLRMAREIATALKKSQDPSDVLEETVRRRMLAIDSLTSESTDREWSSQESREERIRRYDEVKKNEGIVGLITPFATLNATFQFRTEGLYIIVARQGVGKTWLLCKLAHHAWITENRPVIIDTREMPIEQIEARLDSLTHQVPSDQLVRGDLDTTVEAKWKSAMLKNGRKDLAPFHVIEETGGVSSDAAKMEKYNAYSLWIDGAYMVPDERGTFDEWKQITNVCRDLKRLAKRTKTAVIITLQFNRQASNTEGDASNIALGDVAKEADGILGLFRSEDQKYNNRATIKVLKNRHALECEPVELEWDLDQGIIKEVDRPIDYGQGTRSEPSQQSTQQDWSAWGNDSDMEW
jgi:replicative DNA helicase